MTADSLMAVGAVILVAGMSYGLAGCGGEDWACPSSCEGSEGSEVGEGSQDCYPEDAPQGCGAGDRAPSSIAETDPEDGATGVEPALADSPVSDAALAVIPTYIIYRGNTHWVRLE
jgi:hypothetical protein